MFTSLQHADHALLLFVHKHAHPIMIVFFSIVLVFILWFAWEEYQYNRKLRRPRKKACSRVTRKKN